jgi:hypothetical protein
VSIRRTTTLVFLALDGLLLAWGIWLLATSDPDGGRHPAGVVMIAAAIVLAVAALSAVHRRSSRMHA